MDTPATRRECSSRTDAPLPEVPLRTMLAVMELMLELAVADTASAAHAELDLLVPQESQAQMETPDKTETQDPTDSLDLMPIPMSSHLPTSSASTAQLDHQDSQEDQDLRDHPDSQDTMESPASQLSPDHPAHKDHLDHPETMELPETLDLPDSPDKFTRSQEAPDQLDHQDPLDHPDHQDNQDTQETQDTQVAKDLPEMLETMAPQETQEPQEKLDHQAQTARAEAAVTAHHPELLQDIRQLEFHPQKLYFVNSSFSDCHSQITVTALLFVLLHFLLLSPSCFGRASQIRENSPILSSFHLFLVISFLFCSLPFRISHFGSISIIVSFIRIFQERHQRFNFIFLDKRLSPPSEANSTPSSLCTSCDTNPSIHFISINNATNENNKIF